MGERKGKNYERCEYLVQETERQRRIGEKDFTNNQERKDGRNIAKVKEFRYGIKYKEFVRKERSLCLKKVLQKNV